jgi:RHS repeat-associated protein
MAHQKTSLFSFALLLAAIFFVTLGLHAQPVSYGSLYSEATFTSKAINVSLPVGRLTGTASTAGGAANYVIPIVVPPGTNGVTPSLSVAYSSLSGDGQMGMGWALSGLSTISRIGNSPYYDANAGNQALTTHVRVSDFYDKYSLDGARLILKSGYYGYPTSTYATEVENFSTVTAKGTNSSIPNILWFEVISKDGIVQEYGKTLDSKVMDPSGTTAMFWRINRITYPDGNYIDFKYTYSTTEKEHRIDEILYTGNIITGQLPYNKVKFTYGGRADVNSYYIGGNEFWNKTLLEKITLTTENSILVKEYLFSYAKGQRAWNSQMVQATEKGSDGSLLNSTIFKYFEPSSEVNTTQVNITGAVDDNWYTADINGDGRKDIVRMISGKTSTPTGFSTYLKDQNGGSSFTPGTSILFPLVPFPGLGYSSSNSKRYFADLDGDGAEDYFFTQKLNNKLLKVVIYDKLFTASPIVKERPILSQNYIPTNANNAIFIGDFNGDGRADVLTILRSDANNAIAQTVIRILFGGNTDWTVINPSSTDWALADQIHILDVNGDGKDDVLAIKDSQTTVSTLGSISAFSQLFTATYPQKNSLVFIGDFNGDGNSDLLTRADHSYNNSNWHIGLSTGTNFTFSDANGLWYNNTFPQIDQYGNGDKIIIGDFDLNGKSEVLRTQPNGSNSTKINILYNNGIVNFNYPSPQLIIPTGIGNQPDAITVGDFTGEGVLDILNDLNVSQPLKLIRYNGLCNEFTLQKVKDGLGLVTEWKYNRLTDGSPTYTRGSIIDFPVNNVQLPILVVSEMKIPNPGGGVSSITYQYEQLKVHRTKGMLGFRNEISNDHTFNLSTVSTLEVSSPYYIPYNSAVETKLITTGVSQTRLSNTYQFTPIGISNSRVYQTLTYTGQNNYFENRLFSVSNVYDNYGNVTSKSTYNTFGIELSTTTSIYAAYVTSIPNKPTSITVANTRLGEATYSTTTTYAYNTSGQTISSTTFAGQPKAVTSIFGYNTLGNLNSQSISATGLATRTSTTFFDSKGRFPISEINPAGQVSSAIYDPKWGKPLATTAVDQLTTTYTYDPFGRESTVTSPTGVIDAAVYAWDIAPYGGSIWGGQTYRITNILAGKPDLVTTFNSFDRVKKKQQQDFISGQWITTTTTYDARANLFTNTAPYKSTESPFVTTNIYWDFPNRIKSSSNSFGTTHYTYTYTSDGQLTTTILDPAGFNTASTSDATGKMVSATDPGGTLIYSYYSNGQPRQINLNAIILIKNEYDVYARQSKLNDANAGITTYEYDAFGQLKTQTTALGHTTSISYDVLGRETQRVGVEGVTTTTYHTAGTGKTGRLQNVTGFSGDITSFQYDTYGRLSSETVNYDGFSNPINYTYNQYGDLTDILYPGGFLVSNQYNTDGYLTGIKGGTTTATQTTLFSPTNKNGLGQYTGFALGNTKTSTCTYNQGIPTRYLTTGIQDLNFTWNYQTGNLTSRNDAIKGKTENFLYSNDALNRLVSSSGVGLQSISMTYSANGNISTKSDAGAYLYSSTRVNAVTGINGPQNIPALSQSITYTPFLQPAQITEGTNSLNYTYGADQQRIRSVVNGGISKRYYFGDYEINVSGGVNTFVYYIPLGANTIAIATKVNTAAPILQYGYTDYLGSILTVTNHTGAIIAEQNFDAWGRMRNPTTWAYTGLPTNPGWLYRGYTGHEHVKQFGLINMNGRMYDPVVGRMLSVDNYTHNGTQGYNRYAYALNNPLRYGDPDGETPVHLIAGLVGAVLGGVFNAAANWRPGDWQHNLASFGVGALAGAITGVTGGIAAGAGTGAIAGMTGGAVGSAIGGVYLQTGNIVIGNQNSFNLKEYGLSIVAGGVIGGAVGAISAHLKGLKWTTGGPKDAKIPSPPLKSGEVTGGSAYCDGILNDEGKVIGDFVNGLKTSDLIEVTVEEVAAKRGSYVVYEGVDAAGKVRYVGITGREAAVRFGEHVNSRTARSLLDYRVIDGATGLSKIGAKVWEQTLIKQYGLGKNEGLLLNKIHSIAPKNWWQYGIK